jgi:hypothetical protein
MNLNFRDYFPAKITKDQAKDTGMAMVLICLIAGFFSHNDFFFKLAIVLLVVDMIVPRIFAPVAVIWLGLSRLLGTVISKILLTIVFFVLVVPVGLFRRLIGKDALQLKKFGRGEGSVMTNRDHLYGPADVEKPY